MGSATIVRLLRSHTVTMRPHTDWEWDHTRWLWDHTHTQTARPHTVSERLHTGWEWDHAHGDCVGRRHWQTWSRWTLSSTRAWCGSKMRRVRSLLHLTWSSLLTKKWVHFNVVSFCQCLVSLRRAWFVVISCVWNILYVFRLYCGGNNTECWFVLLRFCPALRYMMIVITADLSVCLSVAVIISFLSACGRNTWLLCVVWLIELWFTREMWLINRLSYDWHSGLHNGLTDQLTDQLNWVFFTNSPTSTTSCSPRNWAVNGD